MAAHFSILAWGIPWTEEPGRLQSLGSHRVGHNWSNLACMHIWVIWRLHCGRILFQTCWCWWDSTPQRLLDRSALNGFLHWATPNMTAYFNRASEKNLRVYAQGKCFLQPNLEWSFITFVHSIHYGSSPQFMGKDDRSVPVSGGGGHGGSS